MLLFFPTDLLKAPTLPLPGTNPFLNLHLHSWSTPSYTFPSFSAKPRSCWLILLPFQVQKKSGEAEEPSESSLGEQAPCSSTSCPRSRDIPIKPTIFICYHKLKKTHNENKQIRHKEPWNTQPFQVTACGSSKCRAWVRDLERATAASEEATEMWSNI